MLRLPRTFLAVEKRVGELDVSVTKIEVDDAVSSGISMRAIGADLVPVYEEHETRLEFGIGLERWGTMDYMEKAMIVAVRRNRLAVRNLQSESETKAAKRKAKR